MGRCVCGKVCVCGEVGVSVGGGYGCDKQGCDVEGCGR